MNIIFLSIAIFAIVLTICLTIVESKRRKYENNKLKNNIKNFDNANRL
tara:strand:- start:1079 stop:1222 length:144 start_codon:yes stop_codon:yes gene_type:complete